MSFHGDVRVKLHEELLKTYSNEQDQLNAALRLLAKWRSVLIQNTLLKENGTVVMDGPFKGMEFLAHSAEGCHIAKLLGCYEQPLFAHIELCIQNNYSTILNIGCAEGYYAVGLARRMPNSKILAFDQNPRAQEICCELARKNGVSSQITVGALFKAEDFARYSNEKLLMICDIEGAELDLFDVSIIPALQHADLIVESHECLLPGITQALISRFEGTHDIITVEDTGQRQLSNAPSWFNKLSHLDQLLAVWEWRTGPTPWLVMQAKQRIHS